MTIMRLSLNCFKGENVMRDRNAFRYIAEDPIVLDLTGCRYGGEVHERIKEAFGFPDYYGKNWDAMWDCLTDLFWVTDDRHIVVRGLDALPSDLRAYAEPLRQVLEDLRTRCPRLRVTYC